jgi:hypothetical protein
MVDITKKKSADYCGLSGDPFSNFKLVEHLGLCSVEVGFITRISDKLSRLSSFATKGVLEVKDESVQDTLLDCANYCILLSGYLESKKDDRG